MPQRIVGLGVVERLAISAQRCFLLPQQTEEHASYLRIIRLLLERLSLRDVGLSPEDVQQTADGQLKYLHICENEVFSMGVFLFGRNAHIPLHDHPSMTVVSKVLHGSLHIKALDWSPADDGDDAASRQRTQEGVRAARVHSDNVVTGPSAPRSLFAEEANLHMITGIEPSALIDIQAPPYNDTDRECRYYKLFPPPSNGSRRASTSKENSAPGELVFLQRDHPVINIQQMEYVGEAVRQELFSLIRPGERLPVEAFLRVPQVPDPTTSDADLTGLNLNLK